MNAYSAARSLDPMLVIVRELQIDCVCALTDRSAREKKQHVQAMLQAIEQARGLLSAELRYLEAVT